MKSVCFFAAILLFSMTCGAAEAQMLLELQHITVDRPMAAVQRRHAIFKSNEEIPRTFQIPLEFNPDEVGMNERNIIMLLRNLPTGSTIGFLVSTKKPEIIAEWELSYLQVKKTE